jgi:uncharacterized protein YdhG (YjbR/CyaY superfamily)
MPNRKASTKPKASGASANVWSDEERAAMKESARERRAASRAGAGDQRAEGERAIREKIAEMPEPDRSLATRVHELVTASAPDLVPRTYYGMPAYGKEGKTLCFFKPASKFKERYSTFGFEQTAALDEGTMWATSWAITELTPAVEKRIAELVKKAAG